MTCDGTDPVDFTVAIDGGERTDRTLKNTASADVVAYNVYRDAARTNLYVVNQPQQFTTVSVAYCCTNFRCNCSKHRYTKHKAIIKILY